MKRTIEKIVDRLDNYEKVFTTDARNTEKEIVEQLKQINSTLEEIHEELHEISNRGSTF